MGPYEHGVHGAPRAGGYPPRTSVPMPGLLAVPPGTWLGLFLVHVVVERIAFAPRKQALVLFTVAPPPRPTPNTELCTDSASPGPSSVTG